MFLKKAILLLTVLSLCLALCACGYSDVEGIIKGLDGKPVAEGTIALKKIKKISSDKEYGIVDGINISQLMGDEINRQLEKDNFEGFTVAKINDGRFSFEEVKRGSYLVVLTYALEKEIKYSQFAPEAQDGFIICYCPTDSENKNRIVGVREIKIKGKSMNIDCNLNLKQ